MARRPRARLLDLHPMTANPAPLAARRSGLLAGRARVPGDKSISIRALMLGALGGGAVLGAVAGCPVTATFDGDASLRKRPMRRVLDPWERIGARTLASTDGRLPLTLAGARDPIPIVYRPSVPSAQLKSAALLAGLAAPGETVVIGAEATRDHTEKMLTPFCAQGRV